MSTEYLLYNNITHEIVNLCDYDDEACITALQQEKGIWILTPENYGDKYAYPAFYISSLGGGVDDGGIRAVVFDQSEANKTHGEWTIMSR